MHHPRYRAPFTATTTSTSNMQGGEHHTEAAGVGLDCFLGS
jgi:hypothetical protein